MSYNGHPTYEHWNVALYFANEYDLYHTLLNTIKYFGNDTGKASRYLATNLEEWETPDGVALTEHMIKYGLDCLIDEE